MITVLVDKYRFVLEMQLLVHMFLQLERRTSINILVMFLKFILLLKN